MKLLEEWEVIEILNHIIDIDGDRRRKLHWYPLGIENYWPSPPVPGTKFARRRILSDLHGIIPRGISQTLPIVFK